jgi:hypothetical protein
VKAMDVMVRNVLTVKPDTSVVEVAPDCSLRTTSARGLSSAMRSPPPWPLELSLDFGQISDPPERARSWN